MIGLDAGVAWFPGADHVRQGTVCGVFGRAWYLRLGDRLLALCRADVASGPLHLRIPVLPAVRVGDPVVFQSGWLSVGSLTIAVDRTPRWAPAPLAAQDLQRRAGNATPSPPQSTAGLDDVLEPARERVADHDLAGLARLVGGRGPGLTPAGDDLLAGVLVIDAVLRPGNDAAREAAARAVRTTDVAAAFLHWAARGQCIAPVHDVLSAIAEGRPDRQAAARATLLAIGASSGAALLLGLDLALWAATPAVDTALVRT